MKTLLILRHAKSSWKNNALSDHDRPLNPRGQRDAPNVGKRLRNEDLIPDAILSSTAKRACQTAEAVAQESGCAGELQLSGELYGGGPEAYLEAIRNLPSAVDCALVVGHNPDLEELVEGAQQWAEENLLCAGTAQLTEQIIVPGAVTRHHLH